MIEREPTPLPRRQAAPRPAGRTVEVEISEGAYAGWRATCLVDYPIRLVRDLASGDLERVLAAIRRIVVDHNMPDESGEIAADVADVDPYGGLMAIMQALQEAQTRLPPR